MHTLEHVDPYVGLFGQNKFWFSTLFYLYVCINVSITFDGVKLGFALVLLVLVLQIEFAISY